MKNSKAANVKYLILFNALFAVPRLAMAQGMPWESPLRQILNSVQGPTLTIILTLAIVVSGLVFALGEAGGFYRRMASVVFGGAIAVGAASLVTGLFGASA